MKMRALNTLFLRGKITLEGLKKAAGSGIITAGQYEQITKTPFNG